MRNKHLCNRRQPTREIHLELNLLNRNIAYGEYELKLSQHFKLPRNYILLMTSFSSRPTMKHGQSGIKVVTDLVREEVSYRQQELFRLG